jgi:hypothetical protein
MEKDIYPYFVNFYFLICKNRIIELYCAKKSTGNTALKLKEHRKTCETCKNAHRDGFEIPSKIKFVEEFPVRSEKLLMLQKRVIKQEYGLI